MTKTVNFFVTLLLIILAYTISILLKSVGDALTLVGSTITPGLGFIIPIVFYSKIHSSKPFFWSYQRILPALVAVIITTTSILDLWTFFFYKTD